VTDGQGELMNMPAFGLNRFDFSTPAAFAEDVARAEQLGWDYAFVPDSQMRRHDTYVLLAFAAAATDRIGIGTLLANPITRHPTVTAGSIATVDQLSNGRALLGLGIGDTAVRLAGLKPASVARLEDATLMMRTLLKGDAVNLGANSSTRIPHPRHVPVWIAAAGPRMLRAAGRVADGVFIRVGRGEALLHSAVAAIHQGAEDAGRDPDSIRLGLVLHTVLDDDAERALTIGKSVAAGYYEYSPHLFEIAGLTWNGPDVHELQRLVNPDFHHHSDLIESGRLVEFLPDAAADAFCVRGGVSDISSQLIEVLSQGINFEIVVPHPVPNPPLSNEGSDPTYMETIAREVMPLVKNGLR